MIEYHYYTDGVNEDLVYELPMYIYVGVEMPTSIFDAMFGRPTIGEVSQMDLERLDDEDVFFMKSRGLIPTRIPYPDVLSDRIINGSFGIRDDDFLIVS